MMRTEDDLFIARPIKIVGQGRSFGSKIPIVGMNRYNKNSISTKV